MTSNRTALSLGSGDEFGLLQAIGFARICRRPLAELRLVISTPAGDPKQLVAALSQVAGALVFESDHARASTLRALVDQGDLHRTVMVFGPGHILPFEAASQSGLGRALDLAGWEGPVDAVVFSSVADAQRVLRSHNNLIRARADYIAVLKSKGSSLRASDQFDGWGLCDATTTGHTTVEVQNYSVLRWRSHDLRNTFAALARLLANACPPASGSVLLAGVRSDDWAMLEAASQSFDCVVRWSDEGVCPSHIDAEFVERGLLSRMVSPEREPEWSGSIARSLLAANTLTGGRKVQALIAADVGQAVAHFNAARNILAQTNAAFAVYLGEADKIPDTAFAELNGQAVRVLRTGDWLVCEADAWTRVTVGVLLEWLQRSLVASPRTLPAGEEASTQEGQARAVATTYARGNERIRGISIGVSEAHFRLVGAESDEVAQLVYDRARISIVEGGAEVFAIDATHFSHSAATVSFVHLLSLMLVQRYPRLTDIFVHNGSPVAMLAALIRRNLPALKITTVSERAHEPMSYYRIGLYGTSSRVVFPAPEDKALFESRYIIPPNPAAGIAKFLPPEPASSVGARNVLFMAYYAGPLTSVGVMRMNYWFQRMGTVSGGRYRAHMVSATSPDLDVPDFHHVPDLGQFSLFDPSGRPHPHTDAKVAEDTADARNYNTTGSFWVEEVARYFEGRSDLHFDVVVISGNPFSYFKFTEHAKRMWGARVILDYRDPFAQIPRIRYKPEQRQYIIALEARLNAAADHVMSVNQICADLVVTEDRSKVSVVSNGYDERDVWNVPARQVKDSRIRFVYAGTIYPEFDPTPLLRTLDPAKHVLHHIGRASPALARAAAAGAPIVQHGMQSYTETIALIKGCDVGVIMTGGDPFEVTTKVYDYLGCRKPVLVLTAGTPNTGEISVLLNSFPGAATWVVNTPEAIAEALKTYVPAQQVSVEAARSTSRRAGLEKLIAVIDRLLRA